MRHPGTLPVVVTALVLCGGMVLAGATGKEVYKVIVNPGNPITEVDRQFLRGAFLRKTSTWDGGEALRPVDLVQRFSVRERFVQEVLNKSPAQLRSYWNQQIFSGKGVPPPELETTADVVAYVLAHPGAVGYLPLDAEAGRAKVIKVK